MRATRLGLIMKTRRVVESNPCPGCGALGSIREIVYGMPDPDFKFDKYIVGGCCVTDNDPTHGCLECDWRGFIRS